MNGKYIYIIVLVIFIIGLGYYFVSMGNTASSGSVVQNQIPANENPATPLPTESVSPTPEITVSPSPLADTTPPPAATGTVSQTLTVTGTEFAFSPAAITVKQGQQVTLTFLNNGTYAHNLSFPDLNLATKTIQPGASDTIKFTAAKSGRFNFICTVDSHASQGMKGILIVI
jgi:plastocyanin